MATKTTLKELYSFPGFRARATLQPHATDADGHIVTLERRQKKRFVLAAAQHYAAFGIAEPTWCGTWMPGQPVSTLRLNTAGYSARTVRP